MKYKSLFSVLITSYFLVECSSISKDLSSVNQENNNRAINSSILMHNHIVSGSEKSAPHAIVYKMRKDYSQNVPVILSNDKKRIVSYPDISDVYYNGKLAYPTALNDGYWLDNRGINANVAFLSYTYEEYAKLSQTPSTNELYKKIIDKNPLTELFDCGNRYNLKNETLELNELIRQGFPKIKKIPLNSLNVSL